MTIERSPAAAAAAAAAASRCQKLRGF